MGYAARRRLTTALFIAPAFILFTVFIVYPMVSALRFSLFEWNGLEQGAFAGLDNFKTLFTRYPYDERLGTALWHNIYFFAITMVVQNGFGLFLALVLDRGIRGWSLFRNLYFLPHLLPVVVVGFLWTLILNPQFGVLGHVFEAVGLDGLSRPWLGDPDTALTTVALINAWSWVGFPMVIFLANLASIPNEYREAARIDGAGPLQSFRHVLLPLLAPSITIVTILTFLGNFNAFDLIYATGGSRGGPGGSTDVLALFFYRLAFESDDPNAVGIGNALAVLMFIAVFLVSSVWLRLLARREISYQ